MHFVGYSKSFRPYLLISLKSEIIPIRFPHVKFLQGKPTIWESISIVNIYYSIVNLVTSLIGLNNFN